MIKLTMKKAKQSNTDYKIKLLSCQTTPVNNVLPSQGEMLMGRKLKSNLPTKIAFLIQRRYTTV